MQIILGDPQLEDHEELSAQEAVDTLFMTIPAERIFKHLRGYGIARETDGEKSDATVLSLAPTDACITTILR